MNNEKIRSVSDFIELAKLDDNSLLRRMDFPFEENGEVILEWMDRHRLTGYINSIERHSVKHNVAIYDVAAQLKYDFMERLLKLIEPYLRKDERFAPKCPEEGEFYGYKFVTIDKNIRNIDGPYDIGIAKLKIPEDAKRVSPILLRLNAVVIWLLLRKLRECESKEIRAS